MSIAEKYEELRAQCGKRDRIFIFKGVPNPQGGYFVEPYGDPDEGGEIPMLRIFTVMPQKQEQRLQDLQTNGWHEFRPEPAPAAVKTTTTKKK